MKTVVFVTGTRADYGKIKSLISAMNQSDMFEVHIYITGMHLLEEYGSTYKQVLEDNLGDCFVEESISLSSHMDENLANTTLAFSHYIHDLKPDFIIVHGDRVDALAGAMVGMLNNIRVVHIEGGELTGTVDDSIRHAITKMAHIHMTANEETRSRLLQLGEPENSIYVIGSPDIDIMLSDDLPDINTVKEKHNISFEQYGIFVYHPVVTEVDFLESYMDEIEDALINTDKNYIIIYPNNDMGSEIIVRHLKIIENNISALSFRSIPFEDFLVILKNAEFIMGNSSAGIREACIYGVPCINIGTRQNRRFNSRILKNIISVSENKDEIIRALNNLDVHRLISYYYGHGNSTDLFMEAMIKESVSGYEDGEKIQKSFVDSRETKKRIEQFINEGCE